MSKEDLPKKGNRLVALSGIGFQMGVTIFIFAYLGKYLDAKYPSEKKWWTIGLTLFGVAVALYFVLKQVNKINSKDD
jgi:hypothetical protein